MTLRKSTRIWLALFAAGILLSILDGPNDRLGVFGDLAGILAFLAFVVLCSRAIAALFRLIVRRLTLRLAFSYFLIGIVPIPLLAALLAVGTYILAHQIMARRVQRELVAISEEAGPGSPQTFSVRTVSGRVIKSELPWLPKGEEIAWSASLTSPRIVVHGTDAYLATVKSSKAKDQILFLGLSDPPHFWLQRLADRTGYSLRLELGDEEPSVKVSVGQPRSPPQKSQTGESRESNADEDDKIVVRPATRPASKGIAFFSLHLEEAAASYSRSKKGPVTLAAFLAQVPMVQFLDDLFGKQQSRAAEIAKIAMVSVAGSLLVVYLVALVIAFVLVGTITRNVNRMTKAARGIARGDFSARVASKSRDQIGDLSRSFDGMAASIESLLAETAKKERLEGEIAIARTIQQKLLPAARENLPGLSLLAHFEPVAEIGGDYYDYFSMPDGRTAIVAGDVSGHGLPTGLLVAMAKASLSTLIETGLTDSRLFDRLNDLIYRSTDSRNYMTLAMFAYDSVTREGELTNAGQLAPYRVSRSGIESLALPSFPLGVSSRADFPTKGFSFQPGDLVLFATDGFVEASNPEGEPYGFERLEALLRRKAGAFAEDLRGALLAEIRTHSAGKAPEDDRTLILLTIE